MDWARVPAYVTGTVNQGTPARNEYLAAEDRILKVSWKRLKLSAAELATLGALPVCSENLVRLIQRRNRVT